MPWMSAVTGKKKRKLVDFQVSNNYIIIIQVQYFSDDFSNSKMVCRQDFPNNLP